MRPTFVVNTFKFKTSIYYNLHALFHQAATTTTGPTGLGEFFVFRRHSRSHSNGRSIFTSQSGIKRDAV
jgi:hypothetical protein